MYLSGGEFSLIVVPADPKPSDGAELYLDLLKKVITRALTAHQPERRSLEPWGVKSRLLIWLNRLAARKSLEIVRHTRTTVNDFLESDYSNRPEDSETMLGLRQLDNMQRCVVDVLRRGVPGDLVETGVWRGGMTILMRAILAAYGVADRRVWVVDSFAGLPPVGRETDPCEWEQGDLAVSLETVKNNFSRYGLLDDQVVFLKGYFSDTLRNCSIGPISILRVDADLYGSTMEVLTSLYPKLSPGGYAIFDDYRNLPGCRRAIEDYRRDLGITEQVHNIDSRGVYWQKRGTRALSDTD